MHPSQILIRNLYNRTIRLNSNVNPLITFLKTSKLNFHSSNHLSINSNKFYIKNYTINNLNKIKNYQIRFYSNQINQNNQNNQTKENEQMIKKFEDMTEKMDKNNPAWQQFQAFIDDDRSFKEVMDKASNRQFFKNLDIPDELCCPITKSLFVDPIQLPNGNIYSKNALIRHFDLVGDKLDPITGEFVDIDLSSLTVHHELQLKVKSFMSQHGGIIQEAIESQYQVLLKRFTEISEKDPEVLYQLGRCYRLGRGVKKDVEKGLDLIKKAADSGSINACVEMAEYYADQKNAEESFEYFMKASDENGYAAYRVGVAYLSGIGIEKDEQEALDFFTTAADMGEAGGFWGLGACFIRGIGTDKDIYQGYKCMEKAAELGMINAQHLVGILLKDGKYTGRDSEAAAKWLQMAANSGYTPSMVTLGTMIINQRIERPPHEAVQWFEKAAKAGDASGFYNLSKCFEFGFGVKKDIELAKHCLKRAKDLGFSNSNENQDLLNV